MRKRTPKPATAPLPVELTDEQIAHALKQQRGNVSATADALGVSRSTINRHIAANSELEEICKQARESLIDVAESALLKLINEGNVAAIIFALKTQGKARGYSERLEVTGADGGPVVVKGYVSVSPDDWQADGTA